MKYRKVDKTKDSKVTARVASKMHKKNLVKTNTRGGIRL